MALGQLADAAPDLLMVLDPRDLRVLDVTRRAAAIGYGPEQLVGRSIVDLVPGATPELFEKARTGRHDPHPDVPLRVSIRHVDGRVMPVDVRVARAIENDSKSPLVAAFRLISERARNAERELVSAFGAVPAAIITWKLDGTIMSWNPAAQRLFGHAPDDAIGQHIHLVVPHADRQEFDAAQARLLANDGHFIQHECLRARIDGELRVDESLFVIRDVAWQPVRIGGHFRDVGELMRLRRATEVLARGSAPAAEITAVRGSRTARLLQALTEAAKDDKATILFLGETGVGKSHFARVVHEQSPRKDKPFLDVNCAGLDPALAESELFGHERGAFAGATMQKMGILEAADGGTLFLDEIAELPLPVQAKLMTFLDDGCFRRVGGVKRLTSNARLICATNADLQQLVDQGRFRRDLYFRLNVLPFTVPPLRDRKEEIEALALALLDDLCSQRGRAQVTVTDEALAVLVRHDWPGNLRELKNVLERALILSGSSDELDARHIPLAQVGNRRSRRSRRLDDVVREHIEAVVREHNGNLVRAAAALGIDRSTLRRKLRASAEGDAAGE